MERSTLVDRLKKIAEEFAAPDEGDQPVTFEEDTVLIGREGAFESLTLVNFLMETEQELNEQLDLAITIVGDQAMSQKRSPFRTIGTLADYLTQLIEGEQGG